MLMFCCVLYVSILNDSLSETKFLINQILVTKYATDGFSILQSKQILD